jgi:hypothetical protein
MDQKYKFPWYDGFWLGCYYGALDIIDEFAPEKRAQFVAEIDRFRTSKNFDVKHMDNFLDDETIAHVRQMIEDIKKEELEKHEVMSFGRLVVHDMDFFTKLSKRLAPKIGALVGEEVEPCYNFLSLYSNIGICPMHMDTPQAKWTVDICIDQSFEWPIYFSPVLDWPTPDGDFSKGWEDRMLSDDTLPFSKNTLQPGNAIIFAGSSQFHYRDRIFRGKSDDFCNLVFFHYVPKGTLELVEPRNWASIFDIPQLSAIHKPIETNKL